VAGFVIDGWWGLGMAVTVVAAAIVINRAFAIGSEREATRAIVPAVGVRLWTRPPEPTLDPDSDPMAAAPASPSIEGGGT
jgi:hypothetical protein